MSCWNKLFSGAESVQGYNIVAARTMANARSKLQDWPQVSHRRINKEFLEDRAVQGKLAGCRDIRDLGT